MEGQRANYYATHFPAPLVRRMLTLNGASLDRREFALDGTRGGPNGERFFARHLSASTDASLQSLTSVRGVDIKALHIGAICDKPPSRDKDERAEWVEMRIDLDITDNDRLGVCKDDLQACDAVWPVALMAVRLITQQIYDEFGYREMAVFYSGRRGAHIWVLDRRVVDQQDPFMHAEVREAVAKHLEYKAFKHGRIDDNILRIVKTSNMTTTVMDYFRDHACLLFLDTPEDIREFMRRLGLRRLESLEAQMIQLQEPRAAYRLLESEVDRAVDSQPTLAWWGDRLLGTVLSYVYPRIDVAVSSHINHLVKSPFSAHASTGRVCVFVAGFLDGELRECPDFDPTSVPTVAQLHLPEQQEQLRENAASLGRYLDLIESQRAETAPEPVTTASRHFRFQLEAQQPRVPVKRRRRSDATEGTMAVEEMFGLSRPLKQHVQGSFWAIRLDRIVRFRGDDEGVSILTWWEAQYADDPEPMEDMWWSNDTEPPLQVAAMVRAFRSIAADDPQRRRHADHDVHRTEDVIVLRARSAGVPDQAAANRWHARLCASLKEPHLFAFLPYETESYLVRGTLRELNEFCRETVVLVSA